MRGVANAGGVPVAPPLIMPSLTSETERNLEAPFRPWPERLIYIERPDAIVTQIAVTNDRPAFFVRAVAQKATIGAEEVVVPLALPHIFGGRLVRSAGRLCIARHGGRRNGRGRQSRQTNSCRKEHAHFGPLPYWGRVDANLA